MNDEEYHDVQDYIQMLELRIDNLQRQLDNVDFVKLKSVFDEINDLKEWKNDIKNGWERV